MTEVRHLRAVPPAAELYARALAGAVLPDAVWGGSKALPDQQLELWDVRVDAAAVDRYAELTGFPPDQAVPATYPSLLGFGLGLRLMTDRAFPLPALGMVHVADRITAVRSLRRGETVRVAVSARDLRSHPKGAEVDIVTDVEVHGETVWREVSTYLSRGVKLPGLAPGPGPVGVIPEIPSTAQTTRITVPADAGRRFAAVSGDRNPIHLHDLTARAFGFRTAIAHGRWTMARCVAAAPDSPDACTITTRFRAPVPLPSECDLATAPDVDGTDIWLSSATSGSLHVYTRIASPPADGS